MATKINAGDNVTRRDIYLIPPQEIAVDDAWNCRTYGHSEDHIQTLADSMRDYGQRQPIEILLESDKSPKLVAGYGRLKAGLRLVSDDRPDFRIACVVSRLNSHEAFRANVIENVQRKNLSAIEEAIALRRIVDENGDTQDDAAKLFGKTGAWVSLRLKLLDLCEDARRALHRNEITITAALALAEMDEEKQREHLNPQASIPATELQTAETGETGETEPTVAPVTTTQGETRHQRSERIQAASGKPKKLTMQRFLTDDLLCLRKDAHDFNFVELAAFLDTMNAYVERETEYDDLRDAMLAVAKKCGYTIEDL